MDNQMSKDILSPIEMREKVILSGILKNKLPFGQLLLLSILAGAYIAFGAVFSSVIALGMPGNWPYGIMKTLQGLAFSLGLILVVVGGAELFTGNNLMVIAWLDKKINSLAVIRNWSIVFLGNFIGSIGIALLLILSRQYLVSDGELGKSILNLATLKLSYPFYRALVLGVLCNIMVCLAVWLTYSGRSTIDKILAIIFPISFFIAAGFEHSVANMYIIPAALILQGIDPVFTANSGVIIDGLTWSSFFINNLAPVTLGNILGGTLFVGFLYFFSLKSSSK